MPHHVAQVHLESELLVGALLWPVGTVVRGISKDAHTGRLIVTVEHPDLPEVAGGEPIPVINPHYRSRQSTTPRGFDITEFMGWRGADSYPPGPRVEEVAGEQCAVQVENNDLLAKLARLVGCERLELVDAITEELADGMQGIVEGTLDEMEADEDEADLEGQFPGMTVGVSTDMPTKARAGTAELVTKWPAMEVHPKRLLRSWLTADERATGDFALSDGQTVPFDLIDLPPTPVAIERGVLGVLLTGNGHVGTVAACVANGTNAGGSKVTIELDEEPVVMEHHRLIAKAMPAIATVHLANGEIWTSKGVPQPQGYGMFPDCQVVRGVAQPLEAKFKMMKA